jgi:hypothetical protein
MFFRIFYLFIGLLIGASIGILLVPALVSIKFIETYQTLITGILALIAATATIYVMNTQVQQVDDAQKENRERHNFAARAVMPPALDSLCGYTSASIEFLLHARDAPPGPALPGSSPVQVPAISESSIKVLRECIESAEIPDRQRIADLISAIQIQNARIRDVYTTGGARRATLTNIDHYIFNSIVIQAQINVLFPYARRETTSVPIVTREAVIQAAKFFVIDQDTNPNVQALIDRHYRLCTD